MDLSSYIKCKLYLTLRGYHENCYFLFLCYRKFSFCSETVKLISIPKAIRENRNKFEYDRIGFSYPLYIMGLPVIVEKFITKSDFYNVKYCFSVTTAGVTPGVPNPRLDDLLKSKNLRLNNYMWVYFTSSYI